MFRSGQAVFQFGDRLIHVQDESSLGRRKKIHVTELLLLDNHPDPEKAVGSNSLKSTYKEKIPVKRGGHNVMAQITQHKTIRKSLLPIYCTAVLDTLVDSEPIEFRPEA